MLSESVSPEMNLVQNLMNIPELYELHDRSNSNSIPRGMPVVFMHALSGTSKIAAQLQAGLYRRV
jgi:hypothetical protein